jgi:Restriction endonuclease
MPRHDLSKLSNHDLEELSRDLLQAEWDVALEAFTTGRDSGIDLRRATASEGTTIIQCKHYAASGYRKLLSHLRNEELPKVIELKPNRYVLVTSVGLTPGNKEAIKKLFAPFVASPHDVIGLDIEGLLSRHPEVERANFKLWLTNVDVMNRVLHNAEQCQTDFEVERVMRNSVAHSRR